MANVDTKTFKKILTAEFEKQALLINRAFQGQKEHFDKQLIRIHSDIRKLEKRMDKLDQRMNRLEHSMAALSNKVTNYLQLSDKRYLELKRRDLIIVRWLKQIAEKSGVAIDLTELERV